MPSSLSGKCIGSPVVTTLHTGSHGHVTVHGHVYAHIIKHVHMDTCLSVNAHACQSVSMGNLTISVLAEAPITMSDLIQSSHRGPYAKDRRPWP